MCKSKIKDVVTPIVVVPNPTITPESPANKSTGLSSIATIDGGDIKTTGGFDDVYPVPALVIDRPETTPEAIVAVAVAVIPPPTTCCTVPAILTVGVVEYPTPPLEITKEVIVPLSDTTAVAEDPTRLVCGTSLTFFWKRTLTSLSFCASNIGLNLSTYIDVEPIPTDLVIYAYGWITGS